MNKEIALEKINAEYQSEIDFLAHLDAEYDKELCEKGMNRLNFLGELRDMVRGYSKKD